MVRITLSHGPSPSCATGLVFFASYYGLAFSEPVKAYQLGKVLEWRKKDREKADGNNHLLTKPIFIIS